MSDTWKSCATCKGPIAYGSTYFLCGVSSCQRGNFTPHFCDLACWDSHVPVMNHRSAWADEKTAPAAGAAPAEASRGKRRLVRPAGSSPKVDEKEILIVASRLKDYIRDKAGMNCSSDVLEALSDVVRDHADEAIRQARMDSRKTVKGRDIRHRL
jgi:histone H3/H4